MTACQHIRENALHLMVQSPFSLFVYWDVTPEYMALAKSSLPGELFDLQVRLVRETFEGAEISHTASVPDHELKGSTYFTRQKPYNAYFAELGLTYQGVFFTLLRSPRMFTPPAGKTSGGPLQKVADESQHNDHAGIVPGELPFAYSPAENTRSRGD